MARRCGFDSHKAHELERNNCNYMNGNMITTLSDGERVRIQFAHGEQYPIAPLGKRTKLMPRRFTVVRVEYWPSDRSDPKAGSVYIVKDGNIRMEAIAEVNQYHTDKPSKADGRSWALEKLFENCPFSEADEANLRTTYLNRNVSKH